MTKEDLYEVELIGKVFDCRVSGICLTKKILEVYMEHSTLFLQLKGDILITITDDCTITPTTRYGKNMIDVYNYENIQIGSILL